MHSKILSTGSCLPERVVTNLELSKLMATSDAWIQEKIGIVERRFAAPGEGVSDLALAAAKQALTQANLQATDIDAIVFATSTPDYHAPGSGALLQDKLGCRYIPAFDVRNTSPGFLFSLDLADGLIKTARYQTVLVVGAEVHSTALDFSDRGRMMSVIFGDGAGCMILSASKTEGGLKDFVLHTEGKFYNKLWCEGPSSLKNPRVTKEQIDDGIFFPQMEGRHVFEYAVKNMTAAIKELLVRNKMNVADVDFFISHQANIRIIREIGKNLNLTDEQVPTNIHKYGNTSAASIPILFDELYRQKKIQNSQNIVMMSFGSGYSWGAGLIQM